MVLLRLACLAVPLLGACGGPRGDAPPPPERGAAARGPLPFLPGALSSTPPTIAADRAADAAPAPGVVLRDRADVAVACREAADKVIVTRDRGQLLREDERDARVGSQASIYEQRAETDRLGRRFERDQLARECVGQNARGGFGQNARGGVGQGLDQNNGLAPGGVIPR